MAIGMTAWVGGTSCSWWEAALRLLSASWGPLGVVVPCAFLCEVPCVLPGFAIASSQGAGEFDVAASEWVSVERGWNGGWVWECAVEMHANQFADIAVVDLAVSREGVGYSIFVLKNVMYDVWISYIRSWATVIMWVPLRVVRSWSPWISRLKRGFMMQAISVGREWAGGLRRERALSMICKSSRNRLTFCFMRWSLLEYPVARFRCFTCFVRRFRVTLGCLFEGSSKLSVRARIIRLWCWTHTDVIPSPKSEVSSQIIAVEVQLRGGANAKHRLGYADCKTGHYTYYQSSLPRANKDISNAFWNIYGSTQE
eukprot:1144773-Pelagomonas_calceolata.AAC.3